MLEISILGFKLLVYKSLMLPCVINQIYLLLGLNSNRVRSLSNQIYISIFNILHLYNHIILPIYLVSGVYFFHILLVLEFMVTNYKLLNSHDLQVAWSTVYLPFKMRVCEKNSEYLNYNIYYPLNFINIKSFRISNRSWDSKCYDGDLKWNFRSLQIL